MNDDMKKTKPNGIPRRRFLDYLNWTGFFGLIGATSLNTLNFFFPAALEEPSSKIKLGKAEFLLPGNVYIDTKAKIILIRDADGAYFAQSAVCSHLGCLVRWQEEEAIFACPCHGSVFSVDGSRVEGPAPRDLDRISVVLDFDGKLLVDKAIKVDRDYKLKV